MWNIMQCAVQGRGHIKSNTPCQDKTDSLYTNDTFIIALADGAGSARFSHYGAESVTKFICLELSEKFDSYFANNDGVVIKQQLLDGLLEVLSERAEQLECEINDLASTLLVVAVKNEQFIMAHIGDGVIGYLKNNELKTASCPENGEFVNTTVFTTSKDAIMTMKLINGDLGEICGFVLMSDGSEASLYNKQEHKIADIVKKIMQISTFIPIEKLQEQLRESFEKVIIKTTSDDCSIAMLVKGDESFEGYLQLSNEDKCKLLEINTKSPKKMIKKYDDILVFLMSEHTLSQISQEIHLKEKYVKKYLDRLCKLNLVEKHSNCYRTILIMNTQNNKHNMCNNINPRKSIYTFFRHMLEKLVKFSLLNKNQ
ncbi:hypothetical protein CCY99_03505 [Helicobacter sp. 16-1353]|nr:hypothetical protein CCY99_03505 [Helicobacter sp. 16-1353]